MSPGVGARAARRRALGVRRRATRSCASRVRSKDRTGSQRAGKACQHAGPVHVRRACRRCVPFAASRRAPQRRVQVRVDLVESARTACRPSSRKSAARRAAAWEDTLQRGRCVRGRRLRAARFRFASPPGAFLLMHARWLPAAVDQIRGCWRHRDVVRHPLAGGPLLPGAGPEMRGRAVLGMRGC